jgi:flavodoxin-like protein
MTRTLSTPASVAGGPREATWETKGHEAEDREKQMKALVVYESMFGNTEKVAGAVARGLQLEDVDAGLVEVGSATTELSPGLDLLVVGAPTHAFGLSRPGTRADAVRQGAEAERTRLGLREWLESLRFDPVRPPLLAAFDTRVTKVRWVPKSAGPSAVHLARRHGLEAVGKPVGFLVDDVRGPLLAGELDRAVAWGRRLGLEGLERLVAREVRARR